MGCICSVRLVELNFKLRMNLIRCKKLEYTTETHITYTPCYTQYGLLSRMFVWNKNKNFLKICGGKFNFESLYIYI